MAQFSVKIKNTKVPASQTSFPAIVDLADMPAAFHSTVTPSGGDIRCFESDGTTELARAVVSYDAATDTGELWVKVSNLSAIADTEIIVDVDGARSDYAATDIYGSEAVFTEAQIAVLMESTTPIDWAGNHTLMAENDITIVSGPYGTALNFEGFRSDLYTTETGIVNLPTSFDMTVSVISRVPLLDGRTNSATVGWSGADDLILYSHEDDGNPVDGARVFWRDFGITTSLQKDNVSSANTWDYFSFSSFAADDHRLYSDGGLVDNATDTGTSSGFSRFDIGGWAGGQSFNGDVAQVIVYKTARSDDWITTEYNNQYRPSTFYIVTEIGGATAPTLSAVSAVNITANSITPQVTLDFP